MSVADPDPGETKKYRICCCLWQPCFSDQFSKDQGPGLTTEFKTIINRMSSFLQRRKAKVKLWLPDNFLSLILPREPKDSPCIHPCSIVRPWCSRICTHVRSPCAHVRKVGRDQLPVFLLIVGKVLVIVLRLERHVFCLVYWKEKGTICRSSFTS